MTHFQNELPDAPHLPNASLHENEIIPSAYLGYQLIADRRMTITIANPARQGWRRILFWHPRTIKVPNRHAYIFHGGELIPGLNVQQPPSIVAHPEVIYALRQHLLSDSYENAASDIDSAS